MANRTIDPQAVLDAIVCLDGCTTEVLIAELPMSKKTAFSMLRKLLDSGSIFSMGEAWFHMNSFSSRLGIEPWLHCRAEGRECVIQIGDFLRPNEIGRAHV